MTQDQRSLLVLKLEDCDNPDREKVCILEGLSTKTKDNVPKHTSFGPKPLRGLLALAETFAVYLGCTRLRLFDAANAFLETQRTLKISNDFVFLTHVSLLKDGLCFYEKYGFVCDGECPRLPRFEDAQETFSGPLSLRLVLYKSKRWSEVYTRLSQRASYVDDLESLYAGLGLDVASLQTWWSKIPTQSSELVVQDCTDPFLLSYSDRWMDVY